MHPFRVFVSYSHEDRLLAEQVVKILLSIGLKPVWDADIRPGIPFTDAIKGLIAHAHIFLPLITENSQERPWVHQETGYAMALNIPILPVALGNIPADMIAQLQAIAVKPGLEDLEEKLREARLEQVVSPPPASPRAIIEVAEWPETRTELIAQYANRIVELGAYGHVRQRGGLSSFSIPDKDVNDPIWNQRYSSHPRSRYYYHLLREERRALELHAQREGCSLVIDPTIEFEPTAKRTRLLILLEFIESMTDDKMKIVFSHRAREGSLTSVGDWFMAESMVPRPREGYWQTVFSWQAPAVLNRARRFDQEFNELYWESGWEPRASRRLTLEKIKEVIEGLPSG